MAVPILWMARTVLLLGFAGILLAIVLHAAGRWTAEILHVPYGWGLAIDLFLLCGAAAAAFFLSGPAIADEFDQLRHTVPAAFSDVTASLRHYEWGRQILSSFEQGKGLPSGSSGVASEISGAFSGVAGVIADIILILFVGLYGAATPELYQRGFLRLWPKQMRRAVSDVLADVHNALVHWLVGKLALMAFVACCTSIVLYFLGVPLALTLAVIAGFLDFIPNFGPLISAVPAALLAFTEGPATAGYVLLLYLAVQVVESYILAPLVQRRAVSLPPAVLILSQLLSGVLLGSMGLIVATPLTVVVIQLVRSIYIQRILDE